MMKTDEIVSLRQIAAAAGLSRTAVSLALRNSPEVSEATRKRVQRIASELGWRQDARLSLAMAQMRMTRLPRERLVLSWLNDWPKREIGALNVWQQRMYQGAKARAEELGFNLEVFWCREPGMTRRRIGTVLYTRGVAGLLVPAIPTDDLYHLTLPWRHFACVAANTSMWRPDIHRICAHHMRNVGEAIRALRRLGYRRIGFVISEEEDSRTMQMPFSAFLRYNETVPANFRVAPLRLEQWLKTPVRKWWNRWKPDAILMQEPEGLEFLDDCGIACPAEAAFACLNARRDQSRVAGSDQRADLIGSAAIDMLAAQIHRNETGVPAAPRLVLIRGEWVPGKTAPRVD